MGPVGIGTFVRHRMLWDSEGAGLAEAPAHLVVDVRRLGNGAASAAAGWLNCPGCAGGQ
jgi:hypothetical protein